MYKSFLLILSLFFYSSNAYAKLSIDASSGWHLDIRDKYEQGTVQVTYNCHAITSYDRLVKSVRLYGINFDKFSFEESIATYRDNVSIDNLMSHKYVSLYDYNDNYKGKIDLAPIQKLLNSDSPEISGCKEKYYTQMADIERKELMNKVGIAVSVLVGLVLLFFVVKFLLRKAKVAKEKSKQVITVASNSMKHRKEREVIKNAALDEATRISVREASEQQRK